MVKKPGLRRVMVQGVGAISEDSRTWTWSVGSDHYRWCLLGHVEQLNGTRCKRINHFRTIEAAIAWTLGLAAGREEANAEVPFAEPTEMRAAPVATDLSSRG